MKNFRVNVTELFDEKLLSIVKNDLNKGIAYTIVLADGVEKEIKDIDGFQRFLEERNL